MSGAVAMVVVDHEQGRHHELDTLRENGCWPGPGLLRLRMSWADYLRLPVERADFVAGEVVVSPPAAPAHGAITARLIVVLAGALPRLVVMAEAGLRLPGSLRGPDVMVVTAVPESTWVEDPPVLVVEVLSPSTRTEDTVRKSPEYAAGGVGQFWVVDPEHRTIDVYENRDGAWSPVLHLDDAQPTGEVGVGEGGEHGVVPLDLHAILPAPTEGPRVGD